MSGRGRPRDTYADTFIALAHEHRGSWVALEVARDQSVRLVRKLRREGLEVRTLTLDDDLALVAYKEDEHAAEADADDR